MTATKARQASSNGKAELSALADALAYEAAIAAEAAEIRGHGELTRKLFGDLWPLLRRPIHEALIVTTGVVKGKPYESTGIKSLQVQVNRMDAVLGPTNWGWRTEWFDAGKVAEVTVTVGPVDGPLMVRAARGGVNQASTDGNRYKGSETNAGKLALARVGPGWEVYIGATDLDPDVSKVAAAAQDGTVGQIGERMLAAEKAVALGKVVDAAGLAPHLAAKLRSFGVKEIPGLTVEQGIALYEWATAGKGGEDG